MFNWLKEIEKLNNEITEYKKETDIPSMPSVAIVNRAKKLINEGKLDDAIVVLNEAFSLPKEDYLPYKYLGIIYDGKKMYDKAIEAYQKSADLNEEDKDIWRFLGNAFLNKGDYERAVKSFENANRITPLNSDIYTGWGMSYMKLKNYNEASEKFVEAIKINRYNFPALFFSAMCETRIGMIDLAETKLKFLTSTVPNDINSYEYANVRYIKGNLSDAELWAKKAIEYNKQILPAYTLLIKIYSDKMDLKMCCEYFKKAEENDLSGDILNENFGNAMFKCANFEDARFYLLKAYQHDMDNETVCANLLMTYSVLNDEKIVHILKERLTAQNPQNPILKGRLAIEEFRVGNYETANSLIREICEKTNCQYILDYYLALIQIKLENNAKAIEYFEASLEKNPLFTLCSIEYSKFLIDTGKYVEAKRKLRKALKYDENNPKLLNLLFHVSYILVKEDVCEYNVKEAISIVKNIKDPDLFEYKDELKDLTEMLENLKENVIE